MALAGESTSTSTWPLPPTQYINHYTDENIRRGRAPKPPLPIHNEYTMFGMPFNADDAIIRPLESQAIRRLYPQNFDHRRELKKLNHSILVNFLDLLDILIKCPDSNKRTDKIEDINILFINMHHLINEFRPHQARETVRVMLEMQKRQRHQVAERLEQQEELVRRLVREALASLPDNLDLDSKLLVPSLEELQLRPKSDANSNAEDKCSSLDRLMCNIVDAL
ncbi:mediator of RNA polymerase II transcription subunit 7-like [Macrobrachium nipponense]|uniref:mediator of RNA polymerase II transcription subunit 7-like n=1 Tax=Macrobrachium nipponense TaxID=159736 RepID=UPI0030C8A276